jgi:hypothetical protein
MCHRYKSQLFRETIAVHSESHMKHINPMSGQNSDIFIDVIYSYPGTQ